MSEEYQKTKEQEKIPVPDEGLKIFTPIGMLGYGIDPDDMEAAKDLEPDAIILDSGSVDGGPYKLGKNEMSRNEASYKRDLDRLLKLRAELGVPLLIGSAGGPGTDALVRMERKRVEEWSKKKSRTGADSCRIFASEKKRCKRSIRDENGGAV